MRRTKTTNCGSTYLLMGVVGKQTFIATASGAGDGGSGAGGTSVAVAGAGGSGAGGSGVAGVGGSNNFFGNS